MIYAQPGTAFQAVLDNAPTGLVGTIGVRVIRDLDGATVIARTTANITEVVAGSGTYLAKLAAAPAEAGSYLVFWDTGTVTPSTTSTEEMVVGAATALNPPPTGSELCTLADVRLLMQKAATDTAQDAFIQSQILRVSQEVMDWCERQFAPVEEHATKTFSWERTGTLVSFAPFDLQSVDNPETSVVADSDNATPYVLTKEEYRLWPYEGRNGVFTGMKVQPFGASYGSIEWPTRQLTVTGKWGFPSVPLPVVDATALTVVHRITGNVAAYRSPDEGPVAVPKQGFPTEALHILAKYKRVPF